MRDKSKSCRESQTKRSAGLKIGCKWAGKDTIAGNARSERRPVNDLVRGWCRQDRKVGVDENVIGV